MENLIYVVVRYDKEEDIIGLWLFDNKDKAIKVCNKKQNNNNEYCVFESVKNGDILDGKILTTPSYETLTCTGCVYYNSDGDNLYKNTLRCNYPLCNPYTNYLNCSKYTK